MTRRLVALVLPALLLAPPSAAIGQSPSPAVAPGAAESGFEGAWPREMGVNGAAVLIYQPQIDKRRPASSWARPPARPCGAIGSSRQGGTQERSGQGLGAPRGSGQSGRGGRAAGGLQGLEGESEARDRGFQRFSGSRGGGFRR